jgi:hypothetical protein
MFAFWRVVFSSRLTHVPWKLTNLEMLGFQIARVRIPIPDDRSRL